MNTLNAIKQTKPKPTVRKMHNIVQLFIFLS